jgi:hypothetical protein
MAPVTEQWDADGRPAGRPIEALNVSLLRDLYCSYMDDHYDFMHEYWSLSCDVCDMLLTVKVELRKQGVEVPDLPNEPEDYEE